MARGQVSICKARTLRVQQSGRGLPCRDPETDAQRSLKTRALQITADLAQTRLLLFTQADSSITMPFLAVLVLWLTIIFASLDLFSRLSPSVIAALFIFARSAFDAIFLILELSQPFQGLLEISSCAAAQ
jgi:hypothetical protein